VFEGAPYAAHRVLSCRQALLYVEDHSVQVIVAEADLPDGNWKDLLDIAANLPDPPQLIVFSHIADDILWAEVLNLGGYDVLPVPFAADEVLRTISLACGARTRRLAKSPSSAAGTPDRAAAAG
jgi:DNA-binding NtrC family response regulator